jgi:hypothetical protein
MLSGSHGALVLLGAHACPHQRLVNAASRASVSIPIANEQKMLPRSMGASNGNKTDELAHVLQHIVSA